MVTREQEERVIDLHFKHHKKYREIAKEVRISNRDSKKIVDDEYDRREHGRSASITSRAYALIKFFLIEKADQLRGSIIREVSDRFTDDFIKGKGSNHYLP